MQTIHAEIVKPVFKQLKDPNLDGANNEPSTTSILQMELFIQVDHLKWTNEIML